MSGNVMCIKELRALAAMQRAPAAVPHKVTGRAGDPRKCLARKRIAGATLPRGCHICGSPGTADTPTEQEAFRAPSAAWADCAMVTATQRVCASLFQ
jgi:hypothetical protein